MNSGSHFYILLYKTGIHHKSVYTLVLLTGINNLNHAGMSAFKKSMKRRNHSPLPLLGDNIGKFVSLKETKIILRREEWIQSQSQGLLCRRSFSSYRGLSMKAFLPWDILWASWRLTRKVPQWHWVKTSCESGSLKIEWNNGWQFWCKT